MRLGGGVTQNNGNINNTATSNLFGNKVYRIYGKQSIGMCCDAMTEFINNCL